MGEGLEGKRPGRYGTAREQNVAVLERFPMETGIYVVWPSPADGRWPDPDAFDIFRKPLEPDGQDSVFRTVVLNGGRRTPKCCVPPHPRSGLRRRIHYAGHAAGHAPWLRHKRPDRQDGSKRRLRGAGQESPVRQ